jgi:hypothetical protein
LVPWYGSFHVIDDYIIVQERNASICSLSQSESQADEPIDGRFQTAWKEVLVIFIFIRKEEKPEKE